MTIPSRRRFRRLATYSALLAILAMIGSLSVVTTPAGAASGTVFTVMNTSETPPDGVWFRNSPHTGDTNRITGLGVYMNEQVQLECYAFGDAVGRYNDSLWYYAFDVSRPASNGAPNQGFLNAHYVNDGQNANVVDGGVPACVNNQPPQTSIPQPPAPQPPTTPPPPHATPSVSVAQGSAASTGFWYIVTLAGFAPGAEVSISCRDSVDPQGFRSFSLQAGGSGEASSDNECRSGDGPDHWVVANGVESNHVSWVAHSDSGMQGDNSNVPSGQSGTSGDSGQTGAGDATSPSPPTTAEACDSVSGQRLSSGGSLAYALYDHYMWGNGTSVVVDWSTFSNNSAFVAAAKTLTHVNAAMYWRPNPVGDADLYGAFGTMRISRTSQDCYRVDDHYDFDPNFKSLPKAVWSVLTLPQWAYQLSGAKEFFVSSSGRI